MPKDKVGIWFKSGDNHYHYKLLDKKIILDAKLLFRALGLYYADGLKNTKKNSKYAISFVNGNSLAINIVTKFFKCLLDRPFKWRIKYHKGYQNYLYDKYNVILDENQVKDLLKTYWTKECKLKEDLFYCCYKCTKSNVDYTRVPLFGICYIETNDLIIRSILDNLLLKIRGYLVSNKKYIPYFLQGLWGGDGSLSVRPKYKSLHFVRISGINEEDKEFIRSLFTKLDICGSFMRDKSIWEFRIYSYLNFIRTAEIDLYQLRTGNEYQLGELDFIISLLNHKKYQIFSLLKFFRKETKTVEIVPLVNIAYRTIDSHLNNLTRGGYLIKTKKRRDNVYRLTNKGEYITDLLTNLENRINVLKTFIKYRENSLIKVITN